MGDREEMLKKPNGLELESLVLRCQRGERDAFDELVTTYQARLRFYLQRLLNPERDLSPLLQEVWLQVLQGIRTLRQPEHLSLWLFAITRHVALGSLRQRYARARGAQVAEDRARERPVTPNPSVALDQLDELEYGFARLTLAEREVLTLYFLKELSIDEVAALLGIPSGTVKSRLFNAKKSLRRILEPEKGNSHE